MIQTRAWKDNLTINGGGGGASSHTAELRHHHERLPTRCQSQFEGRRLERVRRTRFHASMPSYPSSSSGLLLTVSAPQDLSDESRSCLTAKDVAKAINRTVCTQASSTSHATSHACAHREGRLERTITIASRRIKSPTHQMTLCSQHHSQHKASWRDRVSIVMLITCTVSAPIGSVLPAAWNFAITVPGRKPSCCFLAALIVPLAAALASVAVTALRPATVWAPSL